MRRPDLTALVGSRICHDLVSPLGAIGNGVELLGLTGAPDGPEMALIAESVAAANARLRFFRVAYGAAGAEQRISRAEVASTLAAAARGGRLSYFWNATGDQPRAEVRAVFLLLQCMETALPHGGDITIDREGETWVVTGEAARLKIDADLWDSLLNPRLKVSVTPAQVQFALLPEVLADLGRKAAISLSPDRIAVRF